MIALIATVTLASLLPFTVSAAGKDSEEEISSKKVKVGDLDVTIYEDGRVKGLGKSKKVSKNEREKILKLMRFSEKEIATFSETFQEELVSEGGVRVDSEIEDMVHIYTDLDGIDHIVTERNKEEIEEIKKRDLKKLKENGEVTIAGTDLGEVEDGDFTGTGYIVYRGIVDDEYEYNYYTKFFWDERSLLYFTDTVATAWQTHTVSIESNSDYDVHYYSSSGKKLGSIDYDPEIDNSDPYGTTAEFDIAYHAGEHEGYIRDKVRIPTSKEGLTGQFASAYGHSWGTDLISVSIYAVEIDLSGYGDKWTWKNSFEIGEDY